MCYSMYHCTKEITSWHLTKFTSRLIRCLCPAAEFLFDPHCSSSSFPCPPLSLILLSCHGRSQVHYDLIPLHMSESLSQIVVIHELIAARIRPRGSMCMEKRIPEGLISKLSATLAETRTKSFLNCLNWKATGCLWVHTNCCQRQTIEVWLWQNRVVYEFALKSFEISDFSVWMPQFLESLVEHT